ncbi:MAG: STAS domain-containing protein [Anaerolineales bacterium]|nr:STAS domain-containing protein [Anaerolineales bacterium]
MSITTTDYKHCSLIKMDGRIDSNTGDSLLKAFQEVQERGTYKIVFDMADVDFMSSKGWWVLIQTQKASKRYNRGEVVLANVPQKILESLDMAGMSHYFQVFDDIVSAVGSF